MANATALPGSALVDWGDDRFTWPLIGGATLPTTYIVGTLIGLRADGYASHYDDTAGWVKLLGVLVSGFEEPPLTSLNAGGSGPGFIVVNSGDANPCLAHRLTRLRSGRPDADLGSR